MLLPIRRGRRTRGQALAEFALLAPIFLFVMFALIELGRAVFYSQILDSAARDGARYAVVHGFKSTCSSGPMPLRADGTRPPSCDANGDNVIETVEDRAIGVIDKSGSLTTKVKWCDATPYQADPPTSLCGDTNLATKEPVPCTDWSDLGDGDNGRGQIVTVCVEYAYKSILGDLAPVPNFTITGRATLVVNN
jgi:hypothetical protein